MTIREATISLVFTLAASNASALDTFSTGVDISDGDTASADLFVSDVSVLDGKSCIGEGCTDAETFDNETTLKIRSTLPNIDFIDTSGLTFPNRDWRLLVNDGGSGGFERFSIMDLTDGEIPFTVSGGAPDNSLFISYWGNIGIGTNSPLADLTITTPSTPTLRLEQDQSSGYSDQRWEIGVDDINFFIKNVSNSNHFPFRIRPGATSNAIFIDSDNAVGIGTSSPEGTFHIENTIGDNVDDVVIDADGNIASGTIIPGASFHITRGDGSTKALIEETSTTIQARTLLTLKNNGGARFVFNNADTGVSWKMNTTSKDRFVWSINGAPASGQYVLESDGTDIYVGIGDANPNHPIDHISGAHLTAGGVWTNASSRSLKKEIRELGIDEAMAAFTALKPVTYKYKKDDSEPYVGFIAEDVPELVAQNDRASLSPMDMVALLTKVVQKQQLTIDAQSIAIRRLEAQSTLLEALQQRLDALEH